MIQVNEKYIVDDKGNPTNVILTKEDYDRLLEYIEELEDIAAYDKEKEGNNTAVSWNKIKQ